MSNYTSEEKLRTMESFKRLINLGLSATCLALEIAIFGFNWLHHFQYSVVEELQDFYFKGHMLEIAIYGIILFLFSTMYGGMRLGYLKNAEIIFSQIFATIMANILIYAELSVMAFQLFVPHVFCNDAGADSSRHHLYQYSQSNLPIPVSAEEAVADSRRQTGKGNLQ